MSREASGQLITPSRNIFVTNVRQADGTFKSVISSQALSDQSVRVNSPDYWVPINFLMILMQSHDLNPNPFIKNISKFAIHSRKLPPEVLTYIFSYLLPINNPLALIKLGAYGTAVRKPTLFSLLNMKPSFLVDAAMRGQEDIVLNILCADPSYLLKPAEVENAVGVKSIRTPLQAAIMATDVQLIERMKVHFERIPHGLIIMYEQMLQFYKKSLRVYYDKQQALVERLTLLQTTGSATPADLAALALAKKRSACYLQALQNNGNFNYDNPNYLNIIIAAHDQAQVDNTFDFQPYIEAISNMDPNDPQLQDVIALINARTPDETAAVIARTGVSPTQTDVARAKPFDQLTLVEKLNRFREELVKHMKQEMIFNPYHLLEGLRKNDQIWEEGAVNRLAIHNNYGKWSVIFSQLIGWAQRNVAEPVKQDIRQGTYYLSAQIEVRPRQFRFNDSDFLSAQIEVRARQSRFNDSNVRNSRVDVSMMNSAAVDGIGYKFALAVEGTLTRIWWPEELPRFSKLMSNKNSKLSELVTRLERACPASQSERRYVGKRHRSASP